jgi:16S rRNA G966 N2-methylase RsmD
LLLKHKVIHQIQSSIVATQIVGRRKAKTKIPILYSALNIIYPPGVNLEQCSSEATAIFKSKILNGKTLVDLTGGFGIDSLFFSKQFDKVIYVEPNADLFEIVKHNHQQLSALNIDHINTPAEVFLNATQHNVDVIYVDPSRRAEGNQKVYKLSVCLPNIVDLQESVFKISNNLLVKTSPLLDLQQGLKELQFVKSVFVVSVENECKEVLFLCEKGFVEEPNVEAINILSDGSVDTFPFQFSIERNIESKLAEPQTYLYEPNASILKAGAFKTITERFNIPKLHPSTHLYTSENFIDYFPGRIFKILGHVKPEANSLKEFFPEGKANITTRNYPLSPEQLKKKTKLQDGGDKYLVGFSSIKAKYLIAAERVNR